MDITMQRIVEELNLQHKSQAELGEFLGVTANIITDWKSGRLKSYKKYLHGIAEFLGVSVEYLRGNENKKERPLVNKHEEAVEALYNMCKNLNENEIIALKSFIAGLKANR